ncbi:response regulator transcription factor [candidate division KSB1 bacterium]
MNKILIIEDSQPLISFLTKNILLNGMDCDFIFQTGDLSREEITNRIFSISPDLIILDLKMPGAGGIAILEELRFKEKEKSKEHIPVIILTALDADPEEKEYLKKYADIVEYVQKPINNIPDFINIVKKHSGK